MATPSLSALAAAAANAVNAARAAQREGEPLKLPIYAPLPGEQWTDTHEHMHLPAVRQWSHPFGSKADPLRQLTELANAKSGYYPLGRNGIWHAGVHFDAGTAGILDQSFVRCLADGEVVAYRIDTQAPANEYTVNRQPVKRPFARNFVLVRHRLQAPKIAGSDDIPPSLTFYSLYMHLQDWSAYQMDPSLKRPAFWPPGKTLRVKDTEHDHVPGLDGLVWLRTRIGPNGGAIISGLARGTEVTVSGTGRYRKLENLVGPRQLLSEGTLQGYVRFSHLAPLDSGEYRATHDLDVLVSADTHAQRLMKLPLGTVVRISGEGAYRKLEWVNQYVHFASLLSEPEPQERGCCVVLDEPVPIKAGALIGHQGQYHKCFAEAPTQQLHLEVFSGQNVGGFIHFCRDWAKRLPTSSKTWLQLPKGTPIAPDRADLSAERYPIVDSDTPRSAAELYLPKSLLDSLKPEHKLAIPAKDGRKACIWYRLDNLLHDEHNQLQSGWVKVEADAQWASPWEWPGYDVIYNRDSPQRCTAYKMTVLEQLNGQARERYSQIADLSDQGPVRSRLFEIIDRNRDGKLTADELQKALELPAHAQSISRLVIHCENEWQWIPQKWNEMDEILGHSPSTPHTNWFSEKSRIEQMCWWNEVAGKVGLPVDGRVWHFHPIGLATLLGGKRRITVEFLEKVTGKTGYWFTGRGGSSEFAQSFPLKYPKIYKFDKIKFTDLLNDSLERNGIITAYQQAHFISQCFHESAHFETTVEFASGDGYNPGRHPDAEKNGNTTIGDGPRYKGKGLIQLTWKKNYKAYSDFKGVDFVANPGLVAEIMDFSIDASCWFWRKNGGIHAKYNAKGDINVLIEHEPKNVELITLAVNGGNNGLQERKEIFENIVREWELDK